MFSVEINWLIEYRLILGVLSGEGDVVIAVRAMRRINELLDQSTCPVHIVMDMTRVKTAVKDPHQMFMAANRFRQHPNLGQVIFVTQNPVIRLGGRLIAQFLGTPFQAVNTMRQAVVILRRVDPGLDVSELTAVA